jgi:NADH-quinone oxidoreductase E subunit
MDALPPSFPPGAEPFQPAAFAFDAESEAEISRILARYPAEKKASGVIPLLWVVQFQMGRTTGSAWVPKVAMDVVAARLGMAPIRVYEVATFYLMFNLKPVGRWHLQVCTTTPCWLRDSDAVVKSCREATGIHHWGETSADGLFTMSEVECLGACANAPVIQVNVDYYEDLDGANTLELIEALRRGEPPAPGSMIGRQASSPVGGRTTLTEETEAQATEPTSEPGASERPLSKRPNDHNPTEPAPQAGKGS